MKIKIFIKPTDFLIFGGGVKIYFYGGGGGGGGVLIILLMGDQHQWGREQVVVGDRPGHHACACAFVCVYMYIYYLHNVCTHFECSNSGFSLLLFSIIQL